MRANTLYDAIFYIVLFLFFFKSFAGIVEPLSIKPVSAFSSTKGEITYYSFTFKLQTEIKDSAFLQVKFPEEFPRDLVGWKGKILECYLRESFAQLKAVNCSVSIWWTVSINVGTLIAGEYEIYISNVQNPSEYDSSGRFGVSTLFSYAIVDQNNDFGSVIFSPTPCKKK